MKELRHVPPEFRGRIMSLSLQDPRGNELWSWSADDGQDDSAGHGASGDPVTASSTDLGAGSGATKVPETPSRTKAAVMTAEALTRESAGVGLDPLRDVSHREARADSDLGQFYVAAMQLAGDYAYAGRDFVIDQVLGILGTEAVESVHVHHNFAWLEDGLWVVRKGATPLTTEAAYIGGSMGDGAVIVRGTGADIGNLASAPHGAGRVMSRTKAAGKFKKVSVERTAPDGSTYSKKIRVRDASTAAVDWEAVKVGLNERGIVVRSSGADEAPEVYKSLDAVLSAHSNIEVMHRLRPLGVVMAGADTFDPYKD